MRKIGSTETVIQNLKHSGNLISELLYSPAYSLTISTLATSEARAGSCSNCIFSVPTSTSSPIPKIAEYHEITEAMYLVSSQFENPRECVFEIPVEMEALRAPSPTRTPRRAKPAASRQDEYAVAASYMRTDRSDTKASSSEQRPRISASTSAAVARSAAERNRASRKHRIPGLKSGRSGSGGGGAATSMAERITPRLRVWIRIQECRWGEQLRRPGKKTTGKMAFTLCSSN